MLHQGHHEVRGHPPKEAEAGDPKKDRSALLPQGGGSTSSPAATIAEPAARSSAPGSAMTLVPRKLVGVALLGRKRDYVSEYR